MLRPDFSEIRLDGDGILYARSVLMNDVQQDEVFIRFYGVPKSQ